MTKMTNYDAEFCGRVPLHQTNLIQPHGALLVVDKNNLHILQASENAFQVFGLTVKEIISSKLYDHLPAANAEKLQQLLAGSVIGKLPFVFHFTKGTHLAIIHQQQDFYIVEIEMQKRSSDNEQSFISIYQQVKYIVAAIESAETVNEFCEVAAWQLKKFSGFDKVMIYRFDEHWNGDVIAEAKEEEMDSYLGLKFPASDIPKQARELYKKTPYRLIPSTEYEPVKIYPVINPVSNAFTDLSDSNLRSVAAVHLEYLRNMKVTASMSTRIMKDGELWGLIACHHRQPNYLSYEMCSVFELLSNVITTKMAALHSSDMMAYTSFKQRKELDFVQSLYQDDDPSSYKKNILDLLEADGVAIVLDKKITTVGTTPANDEIEDLVIWMQSNNTNELFHEPSLPLVYEPAQSYAGKESGLLALPIEPGAGNFILAFRKEAVQQVQWGGNPGEAVQFESDGKKYHPRSSFKQWQQNVRHTSIPWKNEVLETAEGLRKSLLDFRRHKN